jgi:hypothetical protein
MAPKLGAEIHWIKGLDPVADAFSGTVYSDIFEVAGDGAVFVIYKGVGVNGTSTITAEACSNTSAGATTALPFFYRACTTGDTWGDWTAATTAGFTTTAGSSQLYEVRVPSEHVGAAGYAYIRLKAVESADEAVLGGILCGVYGLRYAEQPASLID